MSAALATCGFDDDFGTEGEKSSFSEEISVLFRCKTDSTFGGEFACEIDGEGNLVDIGADPQVGITKGEVAGLAGAAVALIVIALAVETLPGALVAHYGFGLTWGPSLLIGFGAATGLHMIAGAFSHPIAPPPPGIAAGSPVHRAFPELKLLPVKTKAVVKTLPKKK